MECSNVGTIILHSSGPTSLWQNFFCVYGRVDERWVHTSSVGTVNICAFSVYIWRYCEFPNKSGELSFHYSCSSRRVVKCEIEYWWRGFRRVGSGGLFVQAFCQVFRYCRDKRCANTIYMVLFFFSFFGGELEYQFFRRTWFNRPFFCWGGVMIIIESVKFHVLGWFSVFSGTYIYSESVERWNEMLIMRAIGIIMNRCSWW